MSDRIHNLLVNSSLTRIHFDSKLKLGGLKVRYIETDPLSVILVHWEPIYNLSTRRDPYCSTLILRYNSLQKLYREVQKAIERN